MTDFTFNIAKGAVAEKIRDGANIGVLLLKTAEADATLKRYATVAAMLAAGGGTANVEANFTNYVRKTSANGTLAVSVDNANDRVDVDMPDLTWTSAGGAANNTLVKLVVFEDVGGSDATRVPLTAHDYPEVTSGGDITAQVAASGFYRAT